MSYSLRQTVPKSGD
ncbi:unnamed protein product [Caenorhabditis auriculariae]|uniref:Uncharacterized protein n=1 Tax=Caenorhabditis auriculariae TaxID=2777116 RepID=A0A8S1HST9_9PELO|nr:unnamed protein product [Caenorhabditis auriculariae]